MVSVGYLEPVPSADDTRDPLPTWLMWPIRAVAVAVVLPFRLLGELFLIIGRFLRRFVIAPLLWVWDHLIVAPLGWAWRTLIEAPAVWVWRRVLRTPVTWLGRGLVKLGGWILMIPVLLIGVPLMWLWEKVAVNLYRWVLRPVVGWLWTWVLEPLGQMVVWMLVTGWQGTEWLFRQLYRFLIRPVGLAIAFVWRWTLRPVMLAIGWAGRWVWDAILRPVGAAIRVVLDVVGLG
ncbi:hypothetical protein SAMN04489716_3252 [Actinoplanes derwentensis]|uniref:Uncharacterized protein n=1 Tax=Actinoplanes derwentensis TaxID=113562 RepID=A0A1H1ZCY7_9ACTN|nr:hypothetical protein SAMN04489716_3252 [Actinoplanes derwentensis]